MTALPAPRPFLRENSRTILTLCAAIGIAVLLGCLEATQAFIGMRRISGGTSWGEAVRSTMPSWLILAALLGPVLLLFRRFPLDRRRLRVSIPVHLAAGAIFTILHLTATAYIAEVLLPPLGLGNRLTRLATVYFTVDVLTYTAIVGVFQLVRVYNREIRRERAAAELDASLSQARFLALRNQLDPHFIFNALNAINALAMRGDRDEIMKTVGSLAALLRQSLREESPQLVPLATELEYVTNYLSLQNVRFPNHLAVAVTVEEGTGSVLVPALTLHSLIQEAVTRRLEAGAACAVTVHGAREAASALLIVEMNSTPAIDVDLTEPLDDLALRLHRLYGGSFELTELEGAAPGSSMIRVRLPLRPALSLLRSVPASAT